MNHTLIDFLFILNRYVHIIATTVIVGGTLFFEMIVPIATGDLKREQQLVVFGRARWSFRTMVWTCAILLLVTGVISSARRWNDYRISAASSTVQTQPAAAPARLREITADVRQPGLWWAAHVSIGLAALCIATALMTVRRPPRYPLHWMRINLIVLLLVVFLATTVRHLRLASSEGPESPSAQGPVGTE